MSKQECLISELNPSNNGQEGTSAIPTTMIHGREISLVYSPRLVSEPEPKADCVARQLLARATMITPSVNLGEPAACARCAGTVFLKRGTA